MWSSLDREEEAKNFSPFTVKKAERVILPQVPKFLQSSLQEDDALLQFLKGHARKNLLSALAYPTTLEESETGNYNFPSEVSSFLAANATEIWPSGWTILFFSSLSIPSFPEAADFFPSPVNFHLVRSEPLWLLRQMSGALFPPPPSIPLFHAAEGKTNLYLQVSSISSFQFLSERSIAGNLNLCEDNDRCVGKACHIFRAGQLVWKFPTCILNKFFFLCWTCLWRIESQSTEQFCSYD